MKIKLTFDDNSLVSLFNDESEREEYIDTLTDSYKKEIYEKNLAIQNLKNKLFKSKESLYQRKYIY